MQLADLNPGTQLRVVGYSAESAYATRLQRLGLVPGTKATVMRRAPLGDPIQIRVRGYALALRPNEAQMLEFEVID